MAKPNDSNKVRVVGSSSGVKESSWGQVCGLQRPLHEAKNVKPELCWRPQKFVGARTMDICQGELQTGREWAQETEVLRAAKQEGRSHLNPLRLDRVKGLEPICCVLSFFGLAVHISLCLNSSSMEWECLICTTMSFQNYATCLVCVAVAVLEFAL